MFRRRAERGPRVSNMNEAEIRRRLEQLAQVEPSAEATQRATDRVRQTLLQPDARSNARLASLWRTIMKSPLTKLATAAVIAVGAAIGIALMGSTPAFADVVQSLLSVKTASFKMAMRVEGVPPQKFDCLYAEPIRMRQTSEDGSAVVISDFEQAKIVTLIPAQKQAVEVKLENMPQNDLSQYNMFSEIRKRLQEAQATADESVEYLGERQIDGVQTIGYHVLTPGVEITLWADSRTNLPVEMEHAAGPATYTMTDFVFDIEIEESLLSQEIPADYTVRTMQVDASEPREDDLVTMFRLWAEHMDGSFPSAFERQVLMEFIQAQTKKMSENGQEPSEEAMMQLQPVIAQLNRGGMFAMQLPADSDWHYAGQDVTFGDAEAVVFWYRPAGSATYRVIYGDLHVEDVSPADLPQ